MKNDDYVIYETFDKFLGARGHRVLNIYYNFDISFNCHRFEAETVTGTLWCYINIFDWMEFDAALSDEEFGVMLARLMLYQNMGDIYES